MPEFNRSEHPHRRLNQLTGEWVLVSPHRSRRPWQGQNETRLPEQRVAHDPACYLCPRNERAGGERNPDYTGTFVFDNDFAALLPDVPEGTGEPHALLRAEPEQGVARVVCFSPRHDLTIGQMDTPAIRRVVDLWAAQYAELGALPFVNYVEIFENRGATMGSSNAHPHGQIWAQRSIPGEPARELVRFREHYERTGRTLLEAYLDVELEARERIVCENDGFVALVPFWAVWPFETMIVPRRPVATLPELHHEERDALADLIRRLVTRYDNLFEVSFPYSAGFHPAPTDGEPHPEWHLHMHFYPPLLRSATVKKFMVGYEMLAEPQRDITPEAAAARLRALSEVHYARVTA